MSIGGKAFTVRPAGPGDLQGLLALYRQLNPGDAEMSLPLANERFAAMLAHPGLTIICGFVGDDLAGSCTLVVIPNLTRAGAPYALIENVVTHAAHRKKGYGRALLRHAVEMAWQQDCYKVMLMSGRKDAATLDFYRGCGFSQDKTGFQIRRPDPI